MTRWLDMQWLELRFLLLDIDKSPWWQVIVGVGLLVLAAGTALWLAACVRVAWIGRPLAAIPLAGGGLIASLGAAVTPIAWVYYIAWVGPPRFRSRPDPTWLPEPAVGWILLGVALAVMGAGLAAIRRRP